MSSDNAVTKPYMKNINTLQLITEVEKRPPLWDYRYLGHPHSKRKERLDIWKEVFVKVYPNYYNETKKEQQNIGKAIIERWRVAKDSYKRTKKYLKTIQTNDETTNDELKSEHFYIHFDELKFLEKSLVISDRLIEARNKQSKSNSKEMSDSSCDTYDNSEFYYLIHEYKKFLKNHDLNFFASILPITETFSHLQKITFRKQIIKLAIKMQNSIAQQKNYNGVVAKENICGLIEMQTEYEEEEEMETSKEIAPQYYLNQTSSQIDFEEIFDINIREIID